MTAPTPRPEDYGQGWAAELSEAVWHLARSIEGLACHELGDGWDVWSDDPAGEIARLERRLDQVSDAVAETRQVVAETRQVVTRIQQRARAAARRRGEGDRR